MSNWLEAALLTRPTRLLRSLLPGAIWDMATPTEPTIYLTFDDGPIPEETPWVLEQLALFQAQATFFCVGQNLERYPDIAHATLAAGHRLGNHTQHHLSAWSNGQMAYLADIAACQSIIEKTETNYLLSHQNAQSETSNEKQETRNKKPLFRPPYGRLTWPLLRALRPDFQIVLWSVLTRDYDPSLNPETCLRLALATIRSGDIVVFHDSRKASGRLRFVLPRLLAHFAERGFRFAAL